MVKQAFEKKYLHPLAQEGYFVNIAAIEYPDILSINCDTYITDYDDETGFSSILRVNYDDPLVCEDKCVACDAPSTNENACEWVPKGSTMCPLCHTWTKPWSMRRRSFYGIFKVIPGQPAELIDIRGGRASEYQIKLISKALRNAASEYFSKEEQVEAGWIPKETISFVQKLQEKNTDDTIAWSFAVTAAAAAKGNPKSIQEILRNAEAKEEAEVLQEHAAMNSTIYGIANQYC
jgi:hypothetical protein